MADKEKSTPEEVVDVVIDTTVAVIEAPVKIVGKILDDIFGF